MGDVINVEFKQLTESNGYEIYNKNLISVVNKTTNTSIGKDEKGLFNILIKKKNTAISRKEMAEFLWMAAYMLDSEQRWCPGQLPAMNY